MHPTYMRPYEHTGAYMLQTNKSQTCVHRAHNFSKTAHISKKKNVYIYQHTKHGASLLRGARATHSNRVEPHITTVWHLYVYRLYVHCLQHTFTHRHSHIISTLHMLTNTRHPDPSEDFEPLISPSHERDTTTTKSLLDSSSVCVLCACYVQEFHARRPATQSHTLSDKHIVTPK